MVTIINMTAPLVPPKEKKPFTLWAIFGLITLAIAIGAGLGSQIYLHRHALKNEVVPPRRLEVLSMKGLLSQSFLDAFRKRTGLIFTITESATPEELWNRFLAQPSNDHQPFDVVALFSYQLRLAEQSGHLQLIDTRKIRRFYDTSPDFIETIGTDPLTNSSDNRRDPSLVWAMPILWGAESLFYNSKKTHAPISWAEALKENHSSSKVGVPRSVIDVEWLAGSTGRFSGQPPIAVNHASRPAEMDKALSALFSSIRLSGNFLFPTDLLAKKKPPAVLMMSHGQAAFAPFKDSDWKVATVPEGELLWTLSFAIDKDAKNIDPAYVLLNDLLRAESATQLAESYQQASTNRLLESTNIDLRLKPSFLRQFPLDKIDFVKEISRADELRATLDASVERSEDQ